MECPKCWKEIQIPKEIEYTEGYFRCPYCHTELYYEFDECCDKYFEDCWFCGDLKVNDSNK
jgi:hypothetical protein